MAKASAEPTVTFLARYEPINPYNPYKSLIRTQKRLSVHETAFGTEESKEWSLMVHCHLPSDRNSICGNGIIYLSGGQLQNMHKSLINHSRLCPRMDRRQVTAPPFLTKDRLIFTISNLTQKLPQFQPIPQPTNIPSTQSDLLHLFHWLAQLSYHWQPPT